jgi:hypothetical protein
VQVPFFPIVSVFGANPHSDYLSLVGVLPYMHASCHLVALVAPSETRGHGLWRRHFVLIITGTWDTSTCIQWKPRKRACEYMCQLSSSHVSGSSDVGNPMLACMLAHGTYISVYLSVCVYIYISIYLCVSTVADDTSSILCQIIKLITAAWTMHASGGSD